MNTCEGVRLEIKSVVPSFKNRKRIVQNRLITHPEIKERMEQVINDFVSQLISVMQQREGAILTGPRARFWIACLLPEDDCWTCLPELTIKASRCEPGDEGATVTIEPIRKCLS